MLAQIESAGDSASFVSAIQAVESWAVDNGIEDIANVPFASKRSLIERIIRQWVLYR